MQDLVRAHEDSFPGVIPVRWSNASLCFQFLTRPSHLQQRIPGFPAVGDVAPTSDAMAFLIRATSVPVSGVSWVKQRQSETLCRIACKLGATADLVARCPANLMVEQRAADGMWQITGQSHFEHNHGRDSRIIANPKWRPNIKGRTPYNERREMQMVS